MLAYTLLGALVAPAVLASPLTPFIKNKTPEAHTPKHNTNTKLKSDGSFKVPIKHSLTENGGIHTRSDPVAFNGYWLAPCVAGGQDVTMLIDTGSADLWIVGPNVSDDQKQGISIYDPSQSSQSAILQGETFSLGYGTGGNGVSGSVYTDQFTVGTASVVGMPIGSADSITGISPGTFQSGIMGLAFIGGNSVRPDPQPTFMEAIQPGLPQPVFVTNFKMDGSGFLEFGNVDSSLYTGDLVTLQADNTTTYPASWSSEGVQYVSGGQVLGTFDIVFDTGGPSASGPIDVVRAYYAQIAGAQDLNGDGSSWSVPCDAQMPDLEFHFASGPVGTIPGSHLMQGQTSNGDCGTWFVKENSATRGLVGDPFFASNVLVFNQAEATISWAPQA